MAPEVVRFRYDGCTCDARDFQIGLADAHCPRHGVPELVAEDRARAARTREALAMAQRCLDAETRMGHLSAAARTARAVGVLWGLVSLTTAPVEAVMMLASVLVVGTGLSRLALRTAATLRAAAQLARERAE